MMEKRVTFPNLGVIHLLQRSNGVLVVYVETWLYLEGQQRLRILGDNFGDVHTIRYDLSSYLLILIWQCFLCPYLVIYE